MGKAANMSDKFQKRREREMKKVDDLQTISGLRRLLTKMQIAGAVFAVVGLAMPKISPFMAEKEWKTIFGVKLGFPQAITIAGCVMLIVSIVCFLRSYRCAKCGGLMALTHYKQPKTCRCCGAKLGDRDIKVEKV